ncbi:dynein heavy chain 2, axonemal [Anoplophora glabripennis]|nr:dynein heavy chain 2, axonemal [Anoplophora glabripennis]
MLNIIQEVYAPMFFSVSNWPDSVKNDFSNNLHMFLAKITDLHYRLYALTVLYIPRDVSDIPLEVANRDRELIKRLEGLVVYWTKQIRVGLQDQDQNTPEDMLCPKDEYEFWKYRSENLLGLNHQLNNKTLKHICNILMSVQSTYVRQFRTLTDDISSSVRESHSNIEYLGVLVKPCEELEKTYSPKDFPDKLSKILHLIRYIWLNSPYFNTTEKITVLCRSLSNQIILQCINFIDLDVVFQNKETKRAIEMFETCIDCMTRYIKTYVLVSSSHNEYGWMSWDLDKAPIFNHIDSFIQRCKDMIEVCESMIVFGRYNETEHIPKPRFGGSRGLEFEQWAERMEKMFNDSLADIEKVRFRILDVQDAEWYDDILKFRTRMKDVEVVIENLANSVFDNVANVEEGIESLAAMHNYTQRRTLISFFEKKTLLVYKMFKEEVLDAKQDLQNESDVFPTLMPYFAGRAHMISMKKNRLEILKKMFDEAGWMMPCSIAHEVFAQYDKLIASVDEKVLYLYRKWVDSIGEDVNARLNRPLMCKSVIKPGLLECNIDRSLLEIFHECKYWETLNYEIPGYVKNIYQKADTIKFVYQCVLNVVLDYNKILTSLSDNERLLFKPLILAVEKKISPGLTKLTWSTDVGDEYIADCSNNTAELQAFVDDYKNCNLQIVLISEKICDTPLISIKPNYAYDVEELVNELASYMKNVIDKIVVYYQETIQFLILVFEGFEQYMQSMANQWIKYINNFDTLMEEALKICCKNSLESVYEAVHGDGTTNPTPLLKLSANLVNNRIIFKPALVEVASVISNILNSLVEALTALPRLNDKFHVAETNFKSYSQIIAEDTNCQHMQLLLNQEVRVNVEKIKEYMRIWEPFRDLWEVDKDKFIERYEKENPSASLFDSNIARYTEMANNVQIQETLTAVHFLQINCADLKQGIIEHCMEWQRKLCALLFKMTKQNLQELYHYMKVNMEEIMKEPQNLDSMQYSIMLFEQLKDEVTEREEEFPLIKDQIITLDKYSVPVPEEIRNMERNIPKEWGNYVDVLAEAEKMLEYSKESFKTALLEQTEQSRQESKDLLEEFLKNGPFKSDGTPREGLDYLKSIRARLQAHKAKEEQIRQNLGIFGLSFPESIEIIRLQSEMAALEIVWQLAEEWDKKWDMYKSGEFWTIETAEMEDTAQTLFRKLTRLSRELQDKGWSVVEDTRLRVDAFRRTLPLLGDLKNPAMRARHWDKVKKIVGVNFDEASPAFNLEAINAMEMHKYAEDINEISNAATMELQIEKGLKGIMDTWTAMKIEIISYKDLYKIKSVDDCFKALEDNLMQLGTMKSTRFVEPFVKEVDYWERTLSYIMESLEVALTVQRQWLYLENIFYGEDIRKQLPRESEDFDLLSEHWREITSRLYHAKSALKATHYKPTPYLLNRLNVMNDKLDLLQRALEIYLETKRQVFPRFYFISNDDMLEILGNSKRPEYVQPHLKKLFDNLNKLKIHKNMGLNKQEALGMFADDGEYMEFEKSIVLDGPAELWLLSVEASMQAILKSTFKPVKSELKKMLNKRDKWLLSNCGQLCNACSLIQWTTDCTRALVHAKIMESKKPLKRLRKKQNQVLSKLSELSRKDLTKLQRLKANALITIEIHSRDVIDRLYKANCRDINAFEWFSQLRFYWDRDSEICIIKQTNTSFNYGYEYNGNSGRLVITPLTDRCYITLTTALHLYRGGSPKGPAGTGKTETVKDLGKAMGMWVIVNNCSEGLDYKSMGKCFSGLAQTGAWGCFDEFNRINIEVLSVVAQQILCILMAISQKEKRFVFEGSEINLRLTCGIFITMNPGYAGRTELPDNLKSMFRPISMMVPDSGIIAENVLFSDGFQNTKSLAKKVFTLYQLAIQQLSKQDHYDFGLRSMVALLRYAGKKRRIMSHLPEEQVVYLAMRDMNIARFTSDDLPLFNGIMSDIFPGVTLPVVDYLDMNSAITEFMEENNLQAIPIALTKVIQLYETKSSRHSVMILGKTGTAKTVTWKALKGAFKKLKKLGRGVFNEVQIFPLNPKALNLGELYGEYNLATGEWLDGVISSVMRQTCSDESPDEKWILFDGPVDAVWIENMNSVMDDNKVLTLINSDRITMPEQVSLLFEVGDLAVASPATVSRCGMVYNDYKDWGWLPYVTSWVNGKEKTRGKLFKEKMMELFTIHLSVVLEFKRLNCTENVVCAELNLVMSLCKLLDIFATRAYGLNPADEEHFEDLLKIWFLFCLIWSVCCTTDEDGRKKLDTFIREKEGVFPIKDTIYEYFVDSQNFCFSSWDQKLPYGWRYEPGSPFYKIIVPTVDTVRYDFVVTALLAYGSPVLLTGPVGTGKTSAAQAVLSFLDFSKYTVLNINMSAQTTSQNIQDSIESRVEKRTMGHFAPPMGKKMITFLDDLNMPAKETYGSQPPLELLRQWMDYGFWYDRQKQTRKYVENMHILAAMGPPGGGRNVITDRLLSRFNVINMTFPDEPTITRIFGTMLSQHLAEFDESVKIVGREITDSTIDLYNRVINKMLPTPTKIHYLFNLRDISKIFQGLLRSHKEYQSDKSSILKLWIHECYRVFCDRLIDDSDREWFSNQMNEQLGAHFELTLHGLCPNRVIPVYADFVNPWGIYEEHHDITTLRKYLDSQMEEYNVSPGVVRMDLVLFKDAIEHICRIVRVISQPRGNMLLVGIGGSGRQSLSRVAAYICEYNTYQISVMRNYKVPEFKEDLKILYSLTGIEAKQTSFLFNDTQIMDESFLEIINNMLSSGEVANLYKSDEFEEVKGKLDSAAAKAGIMRTNEAMYEFLIQRVRANLHIILCMSPIGDSFRNRLRQYPALINCSTIDWFREWPKEALLEVAHKYISNVNFVQTITGETVRKGESLFSSAQDKMVEGMSLIFATVHDSVAKCSKKMLMEMKRHNYVTPTNYLELVAGYKVMLSDKREETASQANKLRNGLGKIDDCKEKVTTMSVELAEAQVKVAEFQQQCDDYLVIIVAQRKEADEQQKEVTKKSIKIGEEEVQCKRMADVAQADLDEAMPALEEAVKALDSLSKKDISEMKSYGTPPQKVKMVMEAVNILRGIDPSWESAKKLLADINFLRDLKEFDKNHISDRTLKKISTYTTSDEFVPEKVGMVSLAAKSLCLWVIAIEKYAKVWKIVGPKKAKLDEALESLKEKQLMLAEAQSKLAELNMTLQKLQKEYEEKLAQKEELNRKAELLKLKLERAATLVDCLSGERDRWDETVNMLDKKFDFLPGDCLLATAFVSYMGPFVSSYREEMMTLWQTETAKLEIIYSYDFNVTYFLADPTTIREWNIQGLPADAFSTENGIIVTYGSRWPLVIDPQCQAQKWIKAMESQNNLQVIDLGMPNYMSIVEKAVQAGLPVLLQNISETMDPSLNPILGKAVVKQGGMNLIKLDDKMVSYHDNFKFFITTKLTNPHYPPEISTKTTLVNFAVKEQGLEAQLLGIVVRKEKPQLEEQKDQLVTTIAKGKRTLLDLESELLKLLNETRGSLLEDAELFNTLQTSKATSEAVKKSLEVSEKTEVQIDSAREGYRPCAKRAAILFFVLNDMGKIDPMYQFALDSYILLFTNSINKSPKAVHLNERIIALNEYHTYSVYTNTCRALFEQHKLLFSFHMCIKILTAQGKIVPAEYNFLLKGGVVLDRETQRENPCIGWLNEIAWDNITELDTLQGFHGVTDSFEQYSRDWYLWYIHTEPETLPLIGEWESICNEFQRMLFIRSLRQDRVSFAISNFIVNQLGPQFVEPPVLDIRAVLEESIPQTPLIFVLSPGVDPTGALMQLAENVGMSKFFNSISLGQGQAPIATRLLQNGARDGLWIFLANCHLSLSWMPKLDKIIEVMQSGKIHPNFRVWLSSSPNPEFPISILQAGIKMTTEPPKGLKANLKRLYQLISEDQFTSCQYPEKYKKLLFSLCFFHAILLERKKFQQLGWNVIYSFNDSDFMVSENLLTIYLNEYQSTPWDALKYLIAGVSYGGHVTDDWDRRLLTTYINQYFCDDALNIVYFRLSSLPTYYIPRDGSIQSYLDYITVLPAVDRPEAFGQHPNADITSLISESRNLFETLMSLQIQSTASAEASKEEKVAQLASDVLSKLPSTIDYEQTDKLIGQHKSPLDVVLLQEIQRYNTLLNSINLSLVDLQKGIKGLVVMSSDLEEIFTCIYEGRVPPAWLKAYPSLKLLGSWARELSARIEYFTVWAVTTHAPLFFWLAAYTFPTGFLTAVLQMSARANEVPIDTLSWEFTVLTVDENQIQLTPDNGVYVKSTYLEGAGWDKKNAMLIEPQPMQLVCAMPLIHFKPVEQLKKKTRGLYSCPCYYYPVRTGAAFRPAYVVAVDLKSGMETADFWIKRGTALLLSLAN